MSADSLATSLEYHRLGPVGRFWRHILRWTGLYRLLGRPRPLDDADFTAAFVALAAKMAKADGVAVRVEQEAFERFLEIDERDLARVRRLFNLAKEDTTGFEVYAERISRRLEGEPDFHESVLECLILIACSDGILHPAEDEFLHVVARKFGLTELDWQQLRAQFVHDPGSPYAVLGLAPGASDAEVRAHYLKLVSETHPDRLVAAGAPPAIIKAANTKLAAINAAYDAIRVVRAAGAKAT